MELCASGRYACKVSNDEEIMRVALTGFQFLLQECYIHCLDVLVLYLQQVRERNSMKQV